MKYLVTGVAGFIGSSIARELLRRGESVRGIDNFVTGKRENLAGLEALDFIEGDIIDPDACAKACKGIDIIFHEAAIPSVPRSVADPIESNDANVSGTLQLLVAAKNANVKRVVYAGSSSAYGNQLESPKREDMRPDPISPYAVTKLTGEYYMQSFFRMYGLQTVVLRYFNVFGPHQDPTSQYSGVLAVFTTRMLRNEQPIIHGDGEQTRDFTFIENVVNGNLLAAIAPAEKVAGKVFNLSTGKAYSLNETYRILQQITGYGKAPQYGPERAGDVKHSLANISAAREALGYEPTVDFVEGLRRTTEWYKQSMSLTTTP